MGGGKLLEGGGRWARMKNGWLVRRMDEDEMRLR